MSAVLETREPSARYLEAAQPNLVRQFELLAMAPGGVARLRELILVLAVRGKLTRRDALAEPAPALLARILKQKESLIAAGRIKRDKPLPAIDEADPPFDVPQSWCWIRLGSVTNYGSSSKGESIGPETWILDLEDIEKSTGRLLQRVRRSERPSLSEKNSFQVGDVLYGKLRPYLNKVIVADEAGVCTTELVPFRCYGDWVPQYFKIALSSPAFLDYVNARSYGMKMPRLGTEDARNALLPLPPLEEQARIVARVDELMRLCDALEAKGRLEAEQHARLLNTLLGTLTDSTTPEELATNWQRVAAHFDLLLDRSEAVDALEQTILQLAVRGLLVPQVAGEEPASKLLERIRADRERLVRAGQLKRDPVSRAIAEVDELFPLPQGWAWVRWSDIAMQIGDIDHKMPAEVVDGVPYVSPRDFFGANGIDFDRSKKISHADFEALARKIRPVAGDLIYPRYGTIGDVRLVAVDRDFLASYSCAVIKVYRGFIDPEFQYVLSLSDVVSRQAAAATNKTTQPNVGLKSIQQYVVPLPPFEEQTRIVARVTELRRLCADLRQRLAAQQTVQSHLADALVEQALA